MGLNTKSSGGIRLGILQYWCTGGGFFVSLSSEISFLSLSALIFLCYSPTSKNLKHYKKLTLLNFNVPISHVTHWVHLSH